MADSLLDALQLPDSCRLGARITKKMLLENAKTMPADRKAIANDVESIVWQYTLKPSTIAIMPYSDDEREYDEVAVLETTLKSATNAYRIAEVIHRAIPYPLVLILGHEKQELLSLAQKRFSRSEKAAIVAEEFVSTRWLTAPSLRSTEINFAHSIALASLPQSNLFAYYTAVLDAVIALCVSYRTGQYDAERLTERRELLREADDLERRINECRVALKRDSQFNRRVELHSKISHLTTLLEATLEKMGGSELSRKADSENLSKREAHDV